MDDKWTEIKKKNGRNTGQITSFAIDLSAILPSLRLSVRVSKKQLI